MIPFLRESDQTAPVHTEELVPGSQPPVLCAPEVGQWRRRGKRTVR